MESPGPAYEAGHGEEVARDGFPALLALEIQARPAGDRTGHPGPFAENVEEKIFDAIHQVMR
jgi:hypothetical protein